MPPWQVTGFPGPIPGLMAAAFFIHINSTATTYDITYTT